MPTSSTLAPAFCAAWVICDRLSSVIASGRPRRASLPPSSITTCVGLVLRQQRRQARAAAGRGVAADAGVDHRARRSSRWPAASPAAPPSRCRACRPYSATERVAHHQDHRLARRGRRMRRQPHEQPAKRCRDKVTALQRKPSSPIAMSEPIIAVEHVHKSVTDSTGTLDILRDIDFTLAPGKPPPSSAPRARARARCCRSSPGLDTPTPRHGAAGRRRTCSRIDEDERAALRAQQGRLRVPELPADGQPDARWRT